MHTLNDQVFRGFFTGRYLFDSVTGFLRYASPAAPGGFRPVHDSGARTDDRYVTAPAVCPAGTTPGGGPLLLYLQGAGLIGSGDRRDGRLEDHQRRVLAFRAGQVAAASEPDDQLRPALGRAADARDHRPGDDSVRRIPERSGVSLGRHDPEPMEHVAAARRRRLGCPRRRPVGRSRRAPACTSRGRTC